MVSFPMNEIRKEISGLSARGCLKLFSCVSEQERRQGRGGVREGERVCVTP